MSSNPTTRTRPPEPENLRAQKRTIRDLEARIRQCETTGDIYLARQLRQLHDYASRHLWQLQAAWERSWDES
jgi:hypothetical protein